MTTSGDAAGLHVMVAEAGDGFAWRTVASLSEPGFEADMWIGNLCVTGSGKRAVVAYAPRTFTNKAQLADRGAFTAIVDLRSGAVEKLRVQTSLAYFNPGCGPSERAVLTQGGGDDLNETRLFTVNTATAKLGKPITIAGQLTSAVPTKRGIVAADSGAVVRVARSGERRVLTPAKGVPYRLAPDADGGIVFAEQTAKDAARVRRAPTGRTRRVEADTLAKGKLTEVSVADGRGGRVFITGTNAKRGPGDLPSSVRMLDVAKGAEPSLNGTVAVTEVRKTEQSDPRVAPEHPSEPQPVKITTVAASTGEDFTLSAQPYAPGGDGLEKSPALPKGPEMQAQGDPTDPSDDADRVCAVPRSDPQNQVMQPKPRQVEWAVDQAVQRTLFLQRPENWKNLGMPAYTIQGLFPPVSLDGGGHVPAQIMLAVTAQESNMWQAARYAVPGVTANPLIGNYYGINYYNDSPADDWTIDWTEADCGYGVSQVTDGMQRWDDDLSPTQQRAVALDYAANVAAGLNILRKKWNQTRAAGMTLNNGDPDRIENWFFAVWAYNSGYHPENEAPTNNGAWGVGWLNNPVNPNYPADRAPFLYDSYHDAAHPQDWSYPEKIMGWAGHPIEAIETPGNLVPGYRQAWWTTEQNKFQATPPRTQFCDSSNDCEPGASYPPGDPDVIGEPAGPCAHQNADGQYDLHCWYHTSNTWKPDCNSTCGYELIRFDSGYPYQEDATSYPPNCTRTGLPSGALVIDNLPNGTTPKRPNCNAVTSNGTFQFRFLETPPRGYAGKIDIHQIGAGLNGHFWMSNTHSAPGREATGTWTLDRNLNQWARILVHLPDHGARTQQADYEIDTNGDGSYDRHRSIPQEIRQNGWVSIGVYNINGTPRVRLSNLTPDGKGTERIAWDAVAFQPLPNRPQHIVAALGDSYTSGEGAGDYYTESNINHGQARWNACRRSENAWPRKLTLPGSPASLGTLSDNHDPNHELAFVACSGADTTNITGITEDPDTNIPHWWTQPQQWPDGNGQFHEISQANSGALNPDTTLVTLNMGGNDNKAFTGALKECLTVKEDCTEDGFVPRYKTILDNNGPKIETTLQIIHDKAPNAEVVLIGYPELITLTTNREGDLVTCTASQLRVQEAQNLNELALHMREVQRERVANLQAAGMNVSYADAIEPFQGHGGCGDPEWIHKLRWGPVGEGDYHEGDPEAEICFLVDDLCVSRETFHPKSTGTTAYARLVREQLARIGYDGN